MLQGRQFTSLQKGKNNGPHLRMKPCISTQVEKGNIFQGIAAYFEEELLETIACSPNVKIERIVSRGNASPGGFWYDQDLSEWVMVVKGRACLRFENEPREVVLEQGDYINIPPRRRHRVEWTDKQQETIWLAVHY